MKPPFTYFGGKIRMARKIIDVMPAHHHYVEPYCGSLAVLLEKSPVKHETVNDLDGRIMTFWQILRDRPLDLARVCALTPHSRGEQQTSYEKSGDDLEDARRVWVQLTQGRAGVRGKTGWRFYVDPAGSSSSMPRYLEGYVDRILPAAQRLHHVSLESRPALEIIDRYGKSRDVLLYVDPPYVRSTRSSAGYVHEMTDEDHDDLSTTLHKVNSKVVLSGYRSKMYDYLYSDWKQFSWDTATGQGGTYAGRVETVWVKP